MSDPNKPADAKGGSAAPAAARNLTDAQLDQLITDEKLERRREEDRRIMRERLAVKAKEAELGEIENLRAAHGFIQNPITLQNFDTDKPAKVIVDDWTRTQYVAGKLLKA